MIDTMEMVKEIMMDECNLEGNTLGIVKRENGEIIIPKNIMVSFDTHDECIKNECDNCELGGCCNCLEYEFLTLSKIGGKSCMKFVRWVGKQKGSIWTNWERSWSEGESLDC